MTRAGRAWDSPITEDSSQAQVVGHIPAERFLAGLHGAVVQALRTSVPVHRIAGPATFQAGQAGHAGDVMKLRRATLQDRADNARLMARRARKQEMTARDDSEADMYRDHARRAEADEQRALAALSELDATAAAQPTGPFDAYADVIAPALVRLATCGNQMSREEAQALDRLLPDFRMERRADGQWWGSAKVLINTVEGVAEIGPMQWPLGSGGRGTGIMRAQIDGASAAAPGSRVHLRRELEAAGISGSAAATLLNAPLPQLAHVVLHGAAGSPWPEWVGEQWREPAFVSWVTSRYRVPTFRWYGKGRYSEAAPFRQAVSTFAAQQEATFTVEELREAVAVERLRNLASLTREVTSRNGHVTPWGPCLVDVTASARFTARSQVRGIVCDCGKIADHTLRAPEVPRSLLCDCGRMIDAERFGLRGSVRFPDEYRQLKMPYETAVALTAQAAEQLRHGASFATDAILQLAGLLETGTTVAQVADALGWSTGRVHKWMGVLVDEGKLDRTRGTHPITFTYTADGRRSGTT